MDARFANFFISAASEILEKEVQLQTVREQIFLQKSAHTTEDVTILISLIGQLEGMVAYGISKNTAKAFVSKIMEKECDVLDDLAQGVISELGNMIVDLARKGISTLGYKTKILPPKVVMGKDVLISALDLERLVVPLQTSYGPVQIHLYLSSISNMGIGRD